MSANVAIKGDYKVADIGLANFGRLEIEVAEHEMPGLMATRAKYGPRKAPCRASASWARCT
jgi:S-adenosylhomocysteine hydrolase